MRVHAVTCSFTLLTVYIIPSKAEADINMGLCILNINMVLHVSTTCYKLSCIETDNCWNYYIQDDITQSIINLLHI